MGSRLHDGRDLRGADPRSRGARAIPEEVLFQDDNAANLLGLALIANQSPRP